MTVLPSERPRRSFLYRELESAGANFEELNGAAAPGRILLDAYARTVIGVNADGFVHVRRLDNLFPEKGTLAEGVNGGRRKR